MYAREFSWQIPEKRDNRVEMTKKIRTLIFSTRYAFIRFFFTVQITRGSIYSALYENYFPIGNPRYLN